VHEYDGRTDHAVVTSVAIAIAKMESECDELQSLDEFLFLNDSFVLI